MKKKLVLLVAVLTLVLTFVFAGCIKTPDETKATYEYLHKFLGGEITSQDVDAANDAVLVLARAGKLERGEKEKYLKFIDGLLAKYADSLSVGDCNRILLTLVAIEDEEINLKHNLSNKLVNFNYAIGKAEGKEYELASVIESLISIESNRMYIPKTVEDEDGNIIQSTTYINGLKDIVLNNQNKDGSWTSNMANESVVKLTAKAIISLKNHITDERAMNAISRATDFLIKNQGDDGGYKTAKGTNDLIGAAMVVVAMCELNYDVEEKDSGFIKNGNTLTSYLLNFQIKEGESAGGFSFEKDGKVDKKLTAYVAMSMCAYEIYLKKLPSFFSVTKMANYTLGLVAGIIILSLIVAIILIVTASKRKVVINDEKKTLLEQGEIEAETLQEAVRMKLKEQNELADKEDKVD